jgi:hypothetical protein
VFARLSLPTTTSSSTSTSATGASTALHTTEVRGAERGAPEARQGKGEAQEPALRVRQDHEEALVGGNRGRVIKQSPKASAKKRPNGYRVKLAVGRSPNYFRPTTRRTRLPVGSRRPGRGRCASTRPTRFECLRATWPTRQCRFLIRARA